MTRSCLFPLMAVAWLTACAPALDWREVRIVDGGISAVFPCKPDRHARHLNLAGQSVKLVLYACTADGLTWALAAADMVDPALVGPALAELRAAAAQNLGATQSRSMALKLAGATPNPQSGRAEIQGRMPDGRAVTEQLALFARGTRVFQATVLGEKLPSEAAATFFDGLRVAP